MTRINLVDPKVLSDKHLLAEYRELPRIFALAYKAYVRGDRLSPDRTYVLGPGHVRFFYDKLWWLRKRFHLLVHEMKQRGWKPSYNDVPTEYHLATAWQKDWFPTQSDIDINLTRLRERNPSHYAAVQMNNATPYFKVTT